MVKVHCLLFLCGLSAISPVLVAGPIGFVQTDLASNLPGAKTSDPGLLNAWGLAASATSPWWIGVNGSGTSELYNGAGVKNALVVGIPGDGSVTGVLFAGVAGSFNGDAFLFASEDGTVSGWRGALGTNAETLITADPNNVYKGLAGANLGGNLYAYLANFGTGNVDIVRGNPGAPNLTGQFTDPNLPSGYAPFNVMNLGGMVYVSYAVKGPGKDEVDGPGNGIVSVFDTNGNFVQRLATGGVLNAPWGMALAPAGFGDVGGDLLVGNFGDGTIHAFNPTSGALVETLMNANGGVLTIDGLWALGFGNGAGSGPKSTLYFTAGPNGEADGLFGQLVAAPEPGTLLLGGAGLLVAAVLRRRAVRS
jgi:uncharacterized protein (TIGR03118 family)